MQSSFLLNYYVVNTETFLFYYYIIVNCADAKIIIVMDY